VDIAKAQRAGIQPIFIGLCRTGNHRAIKLGMFTHLNIETALASIETSLFLHAVVITVQFVTAHAQISRIATADNRDADTTADAGLLRVIVIAVLLALQRQVTSGVDLHRFAARLRTGQSAAARFRGGLGTGKRPTDHRRGLDRRVRDHQRGTTGDHRRTWSDPVTTAGR
jgi:hypothetical protein